MWGRGCIAGLKFGKKDSARAALESEITKWEGPSDGGDGGEECLKTFEVPHKAKSQALHICHV